MDAELAALAAELRARAELADESDWSALTLPPPAGGRGGAEPKRGVMFVGGPLEGEAGRLFDRILAAIGLSRPGVHIVSTPAEADEQVRLLRPESLVALGDAAAKALLGSEAGVGRLRGRWHEFSGTPLLVTYHPAALLRDESLKRDVWEDMKTLKRTLEAG